MSSSAITTKVPELTETGAPLTTESAAVESVLNELLTAEGELEADDDSYADSSLGTDHSDTTSIASSIYKGHLENGRRWQVVREGEYWGPSDEKQFESMQAAHLTYLILDSQQRNPLFRSPVADNAQNILDVGTGNGEWAREVADAFPNAFVQGVDLSPPPDDWVPPNCRFEVDDVLKPWQWNTKFDLIHIRDLFGSFTKEQWRLLYKQAYKNLVPGGWIEEAETGISFYSDDGSLKPDSLLANWGPMFTRALSKTGRDFNIIDTFKAAITAAGFTNIHEKTYKVPFGEWAKSPVLKEAGKFHKIQLMEGMEGYTLFCLTKFGEPEPWSVEEVQAYLAKVRQELADPKLRCYIYKKRVWAQKPFDATPKEEAKVEVETLA